MLWQRGQSRAFPFCQWIIREEMMTHGARWREARHRKGKKLDKTQNNAKNENIKAVSWQFLRSISCAKVGFCRT